MHKAESNQWWGNNQTGGRKNFYAVETGPIDQLIIVSLVHGQGLFFSITRGTKVYFIAWKGNF